MTQSPDTGKTPRKLGSLRWILLPSLAINLLVLGLFVGHLVVDEPDRKVPRVDRMSGPLTFALSHEDRREIGKALRKEYRDARPTRAEVRAEYQSVIAALQAEPYDRAALEAVFAAQLAGATERVAIGQKLLLTRIAAMTPDQRQEFAARLQEGLDHPERMFGRDGDRGGKPDKSRP